MNCPVCQAELQGRKELYGEVYVCEPCHLIIIQFTPIFPAKAVIEIHEKRAETKT